MEGLPPRGAIKGWSSASRCRMRNYLLTHSPKKGFKVCGITLTIPGPVMDPARAKSLFAKFSLELARSGSCAVWRLEVQARGMLHWHLVVGTKHPSDVMLLWHDCIRSLGPETFDPPYETEKCVYRTVTSRMALWGASGHSCDVQQQGDDQRWYRYLQDHASKGKQEQIAENVGRHWGVIGRKYFDTLLPDGVYDLNDRQYDQVVRMEQRLCTPSYPAPCVFGRSLGYRISRGKRGTATWFGSCETVKRIILLVLDQHRTQSSYIAYSKKYP